MSVGLYSHTTRAVGTILTAAIYNSDHQNHITNQNPTMSGALSDNLSEHQSTQDPGDLGTEVLAANLGDELRQLRFCIERIVGKTQWYEPPSIDLESVGGTITDLLVGETATIQGDVTPAQITSDQNNYNPANLADAFCLRLSSDALRTITGITAPAVPGRLLLLANVGSFGISLSPENGASTAANRFAISSTLFLSAGDTALLRYDGTSSRWRVAGSADLNAPEFFNPLINGFADFVENGSPGNPAANIGRLYAKDVTGTTKLAYRDSAGTETVLETPDTPAPTLQVFTADGTWNKPAGLSAVIVHVIGGGGGGNAGTGGTSSFGAHCSASGGVSNSGDPGVGSGGDVNVRGSKGFRNSAGEASIGGAGAGPFGGGAQTEDDPGFNYGGGGLTIGFGGGTGAGSGGGYSMKRIAAAALGSSESVTVGAGGDGSNDGAPGIVVVEEYYS